MSEIEAKERYYWSKIRQALKDGDASECGRIFDFMGECPFVPPGVQDRIRKRIAKTFTAGCIALGDPAPLDKENDHD